jgi:hypothetical protein
MRPSRCTTTSRRVRGIDWPRGTCEVEPADHSRVPTWRGLPSALSPDLCRAVQEALRDGEVPTSLSVC